MLAVVFIMGIAQADGVPLKDGRYIGPVMVFELTDEQKHLIDHFRTCHLKNFKSMNVYTPYVFKLTPNQAQALNAKVGFSPSVFEVYEIYRGFNDSGPHWNIALRFSESQIEIPLNLLLPDNKAKEALAMQGWEATNPCFPALGKK